MGVKIIGSFVAAVYIRQLFTEGREVNAVVAQAFSDIKKSSCYTVLGCKKQPAQCLIIVF